MIPAFLHSVLSFSCTMSEPSLSPPDSPVQVLPRELQEFQQIYGEFLSDQELLELYGMDSRVYEYHATASSNVYFCAS